MKNATDYKEEEPGHSAITSYAHLLTPEGLNNPILAALLDAATNCGNDDEFIAAFDGATKGEAREFLATYRLCAMPYWGAEELAEIMSDRRSGIKTPMALRAVLLAQKAGELAEVFTPNEGAKWAMARGYLIGGNVRAWVGVKHGIFGHPHNPLPAAPAEASEGAVPEVAKPLQRHPHQENEILRVISELKYDAKALPKADPGKRGVKAEVRKMLPSLTQTVFNKAWERLRVADDIQDAV